MNTTPRNEEKYHEIEKILTDFKNGATYSDSIEKVQNMFTTERTALIEEIERVAQFAYERLAFADYPHCETVYADTKAVHEVTKRIRDLKSHLESGNEETK